MPFEKFINKIFPEALANSFYDRSLIRNLVVIIFAAATIPLVTATLTLYINFSRTYKQKANAHLAESVQLHRRSVDNFLQHSGTADAATVLKRIRPAGSIRAYIFDRSHRLLAAPGDGSGNILASTAIVDLWESVAAGSGAAWPVKIEDSAGRQTIFTAATVNSGKWLLVVAQPASEAYKDLVDIYTAVVVATVAGAAGMLILALLVSRWVVGRVFHGNRQKSEMSHTMVETDKLSSIGELATGVAHEINNPVAIMIEEAGWVQDLLEDADSRDAKNQQEIQRALEQIQIQGNRCKEITSKLLSFANKTAATVEDIELNELLQELVAVSSQTATNIDVVIQTRFQDPLPIIRANYPEVQQIFLNMINNALDAMDGRGGELVLATRLNHDFVEVMIADTGAGIAGPNLQRIFDPFFSTKPVGKGTGLGLSICYGFVNQMGGRIEVESKEDVGSTFKVFLPIAKQ